MMNFSHRTHWQTEENPLSKKIAELRKKNTPLLDLTVSNPTLCGFQYLNDSLLRSFEEAKNLIYEPDAHGLLPARKAICRYYADKGITLSPDQIFITASTSEAYTFLFKLLCDSGDEILAPQPSYPLLDYLAGINDLQLTRYPLMAAEGWLIDFKKIYNLNNLPPSGDPSYTMRRRKAAKVFLTVHPNNPTGSYIKAHEKEILNEFCKKENCAVISDEVFFDFLINTPSPCPLPLLGGEGKGEGDNPQSFAANNSVLTFTLSGISKTLGLPQMKLSWIVVTGPEKEKQEAIQRLEIIADTYLSAGTPVQNALASWFGQMPKIQNEIKKRVTKNYQALKESIDTSKGFHLYPAEGGWSAVLKMPETRSDEHWALALLEKSNLIVHPGYLFDFSQDSHIILSLITPAETFQKGTGILTKCG